MAREFPTYEAAKAAKNPQEALLVIANALDQLLHRQQILEDLLTERQPAKVDDGWGEWEEPARPGPAYTETQNGEDSTLIDIKPVSDEKRERREAFAREVLDFGAYTKELELDEDTAVQAYGLGGPVWLYIGNRDLFLQYPWEVRRMMVRDVLEEDPETARDMGRDVLVLEEDAGEAWVRTAETRLGSVPE